MPDTIWSQLEECVQHLLEPFRASEIIGWFGRHYPDVKVQSLRAHIQGATSNASAESRGPFARRRPLNTRIDAASTSDSIPAKAWLTLLSGSNLLVLLPSAHLRLRPTAARPQAQPSAGFAERPPAPCH